MKKKESPRNPPAKLDGMMDRAAEFARREPTRATVSAVGAGFLLHLLPFRAIASALLAIAVSLLKPALLFLGLLKACEFCSTQNPTPPKP